MKPFLCTSNSMLCHDRIQVGKIFVDCVYTIQTPEYKYCMQKRIYGKLYRNIYRQWVWFFFCKVKHKNETKSRN